MAAVEQGMCEAFARLEPLLATPLKALTDDQLVGIADAAEVVGRHIDALRLGVAKEFDDRTDPTMGDGSLARKLGAKKSWGALETVTRTSAGEARARVLESRTLTKLPVIEAAVAAGTVGRVQAAEIIAPLLPALPVADPQLVQAACEQLVELSAALPATAVVEAARAWKEVLDPDGIAPEEKAAVEKRFVNLGRARNGLVKLTGLLPVEQAAALRAVFDAYANPRAGASVAFTLADDETGERELNIVGEDEAPRDTRTAGQKRADVLHMIFSEYARSGDAPTMGGAHPTILVTVTKENLETGTGVAWVDGEAEPISARAAKRIADSGGYQEVTVSVTGEILNLGTATRCFTPAQKRALAARDRGCVIPGCDIPVRWTEAHHLKPHREGGPTNVINAALLCWWHHFIIDDGPYQLRMGDGGVPEVRWVFGSHASPWVPAVHRPKR